jgi:hypothetical protein
MHRIGHAIKGEGTRLRRPAETIQAFDGTIAGFTEQVTIPANATPGPQHISSKGQRSGQVRRVTLTVAGGVLRLN